MDLGALNFRFRFVGYINVWGLIFTSCREGTCREVHLQILWAQKAPKRNQSQLAQLVTLVVGSDLKLNKKERGKLGF